MNLSKQRLAIAALGLIAIVVPTIAMSPKTAAAEPTTSSASQLQWQPCGENVGCASLQVPIDYARPGRRRSGSPLRACRPIRRCGGWAPS